MTPAYHEDGIGSQRANAARRPRWIVCYPEPLAVDQARLAVFATFKEFPHREDIEIVADAPVLDGTVYVIDREEVERLPESVALYDSGRWLR